MYLNCKTIIATLTVGMAFLSHSSYAKETKKLILASVEEESVDGTWLVAMNKETRVPRDTSNYETNLKGDFVLNKAQLSDLVSAYGGKLKRSFKDAIYGMEVTMDEESAASLAENPNVAYVEQVTYVRISQQSPATWGLDRIDQIDLPLDNTYDTGGNDGTGVTAYIIDSGVRITHNEFKNASGQSRAVWGTNTVDNKDRDCNGHGTHVAGTVGGLQYGVAKNVNIVAVKTMNCRGSGSTPGIIDGIEWSMNHAARNGISNKAVANLSLGGFKSRSLNTAVRNLHRSGVLTVVAAGNSNRDACNYSPASEPVVITVGSTTRTDSRSSFSNHGSCLDIFAPGSDITAAWKGSDSDTRTISGTSMASPHVAGALALRISANSSDPEADLFNAATPDKVTNPKRNSPNLLLYIGDSTVVTCDDSTLDFTNGVVTQDCAWVLANKDSVCGINGVSSSCPSACNTCKVCEDSPFQFLIESQGSVNVQDCDWVKSDTSTNCGVPGVAEACRSTCGVC